MARDDDYDEEEYDDEEDADDEGGWDDDDDDYEDLPEADDEGLVEAEPVGPEPAGYRTALVVAALLVIGVLAWEYRQQILHLFGR